MYNNAKKNTERRMYLIMYQFQRENISTTPTLPFISDPPNLYQILSVSALPNYYDTPKLRIWKFEIKCLTSHPRTPINSTPRSPTVKKGRVCFLVSFTFSTHLLTWEGRWKKLDGTIYRMLSIESFLLKN